MNTDTLNLALLPGARNAIETCLAILPGEKVALIFDEPSEEVAASLKQALEDRKAVATTFRIEDYTARPATSAPREILAGLEVADAGILCMQPLEGELGARKDIVGVVERRQIRYAHMVGITPEIMQQGMRADYLMVDWLSERLRQRMPTARSLTVRTEAGTSLVASFDPSLDWVKTSGLISRRYWSNLPAGEVFTTPAHVDGTFVCDGTAGDYFCGKYGDLKRTPLVVEIRDARMVKATCARKDLEKEFWSYCHTDENSDRIGELAFGTNLSLSDMIGVLLQDEKLPGVHIAFGDPYGSQTHAPWSSRTHIDLLARRCDVWIDEEQVIDKGRYMLERFGFGGVQPA
ncbi:MAG: aminopeptidase [Candidatus Acidiferrales bacterium]